MNGQISHKLTASRQKLDQLTNIVDHDAFQFIDLTANFVNTIPA